jgi:hypothetical protein
MSKGNFHSRSVFIDQWQVWSYIIKGTIVYGTKKRILMKWRVCQYCAFAVTVYNHNSSILGSKQLLHEIYNTYVLQEG